MKLTKSQTQLIKAAKEAGYTVEIGRNCVDIFKVDRKGRSVKVADSVVYPISKGVRIYQDGTANRLDVELGSANTIRTQKMIRQILGV